MQNGRAASPFAAVLKTKGQQTRKKQMKKLMIAAAIVCAAVISQGSQVAWGVDWAYSKYDAVNTYDDGSSVNYWIVNMLGATDTSGLSVDKDGNLVNSASYAVVDTGSFEGAANGFADGTIANGNYLAMVIYDAANGLYGVSGAEVVSGVVEAPPTAGSLAQYFQNDGGTEGYLIANTPVPTSPVPEPTSGLLMLLGMAGLALRRRRT